MNTIKNLMILLLCFYLLCGCIKENADAPVKQNNGSKPSGNVGNGAAGSDVSSVIKEKKLADFPSATIGDAFDRYKFLAKKEWKVQSAQQNNNIYIDFTGWFDSKSIDAAAKREGVTGKGLGVKFVVYPDGSFGAAMASKLEMKNDGKKYAYPIDDLTNILAKIYANEELKF